MSFAAFAPPARCGDAAGRIGLRAVGLGFAVVLGGCATLPSSGPTARQVLKAEQSDGELAGLRIVEIDASTVGAFEQAPAVAGLGLAALESSGDVDSVGPGDVLQVNVFEVGVTLFSGNTALGEGGVAGTPSARDAGLGGVVVDRDGAITLPYVGRLQVAGLTPATIAKLIERGLSAFSQSPQVLVSVRQNVANTVVVMGDVQRPGRQGLSLNRDRLLDAIAAAGGTGEIAQNMVVRFTRGGRAIEQSLDTITPGSPQDLQLLPGDRIELIRQPRTYTVFGATNKVSEIPFQARSLTLAEAVARAGGPNDSTADPSAVFLFRYAADAPPIQPGAAPATAPAGAKLPAIYRLNMLKPSSYLLAQRFQMRDRDVIYIANSAANQPTKLAQIINLLFSPIFTLRAATR